MKYELLEHPPYSPDSAPLYFNCFPIKNKTRGKHFNTNERIKAGLNNFLEVIKRLDRNTGTKLDQVF